MIIAAPRSGTAWAANWLTCGKTLCIHDPLWDHHYGDLDSLEFPGKEIVGVACTGLALWPDWINAHPAHKVILHRDPKEVNESCRRLGFGTVPVGLFKCLDKLRGFHVDWSSLFNSAHARDIHEHLLVEPFDEVRHHMLCTLNVTSNYEARKQNPTVIDKIRAEGIPASLHGTSDQRPGEPATYPPNAPSHKDTD